MRVANRILLLVRHGQFVREDDLPGFGSLTGLGKRQAQRIAKRLAAYPIDRVYASTATRALETADIIGTKIDAPLARSRLLLEGVPTQPQGIDRVPRNKLAEDRARMERAFERFFRPTRGRDRRELLVCHGNIIRYLIRLAIGDDPSNWWRSDINHCGMSTVVIFPDGSGRVLGINDTGHLPPTLQTFV